MAARKAGNKEESRLLNAHLDKLQARVYAAQQGLINSGQTVTAGGIKNILLGNSDKPKMVCNVFAQHNREMKEFIGKDFSIGTFNRYEAALGNVKLFFAYNFFLAMRSSSSLVKIALSTFLNLPLKFKYESRFIQPLPKHMLMIFRNIFMCFTTALFPIPDRAQMKLVVSNEGKIDPANVESVALRLAFKKPSVWRLKTSYLLKVPIAYSCPTREYIRRLCSTITAINIRCLGPIPRNLFLILSAVASSP